MINDDDDLEIQSLGRYVGYEELYYNFFLISVNENLYKF